MIRRRTSTTRGALIFLGQALHFQVMREGQRTMESLLVLLAIVGNELIFVSTVFRILLIIKY